MLVFFKDFLLFGTKKIIFLYIFNIVYIFLICSKINSFRGLNSIKSYNKTIYFTLSLFLFNLAGLPILPNFLSKFFLMSMYSDIKTIFIVVVMNFNFFYFYIKNIKPVFFHKSFLLEKSFFGKGKVILNYYFLIYLLLFIFFSSYFLVFISHIF